MYRRVPDAVQRLKSAFTRVFDALCVAPQSRDPSSLNNGGPRISSATLTHCAASGAKISPTAGKSRTGRRTVAAVAAEAVVAAVAGPAPVAAAAAAAPVAPAASAPVAAFAAAAEPASARRFAR